MAALVLCLAAGSAQAEPLSAAKDEPEPDIGITPIDPADELRDEIEEARGIPELAKLRTPHSPAFVLLGAAPAQIQRPTTPVDFAVALTSDWGTAGGQLTLPRSLAIEVAPYWWFSHRQLTFDDYVNAPWWTLLVRNLSVSVGTSSRDITTLLDTTTETRLAAGIQTQLYSGTTRADICAGDVRDKARILARRIVEAMVAETRGLPDDLVFAVKEQTWDELATILAEREQAQARVERADKALREAGPQEHERRAQALRDKQAAQDDLSKASARLTELHTRSKEELERMIERQAQAQRAVDEAGTPEQKQKAERALQRATQARGIAEEKVAITAQWEQVKAEQARQRRDEARASQRRLEQERVEASEQRKQRLLQEEDKQLQEIVAMCKDASTARHGLNIAIAGAVAGLFPDSTFGSRSLDSWAMWTTVSYSWKDGTTVASLLRLAATGTEDDALEEVLDVGGRVIKAKDRYAASIEVVGRVLASERGVRAAVIGEYMLSKGSWLSISFGKDFTQEGKIFSLANLNWGFGGEPTLPK